MYSQIVDLLTLRRWLLVNEGNAILQLASHRKHVLSQLTALSYDSDSTVSQRAIQAAGLAARIIAERDPEFVRNTLLRLFWLVNEESGGIGWCAPELIGEILHHCPQFEQFFPMLISLLDLEEEDAPRFRSGTLWAIGRVAQVAKEAMLPALPRVQAYLLDENSKDVNVKEQATWCIEQLRQSNETQG
ncbi:MAG: hypothetical protein Fur0043_16640 [Anaerolineales bacterium]